MGEVVHAALMPSLSSDQIFMVWGGHRTGLQRYNLKKSADDAKWLRLSILTALVNLQKQTYEHREEALLTSTRKPFLLTSEAHSPFAHCCASVPEGRQLCSFQTKLHDV